MKYKKSKLNQMFSIYVFGDCRQNGTQNVLSSSYIKSSKLNMNKKDAKSLRNVYMRMWYYQIKYCHRKRKQMLLLLSCATLVCMHLLSVWSLKCRFPTSTDLSWPMNIDNCNHCLIENLQSWAHSEAFSLWKQSSKTLRSWNIFFSIIQQYFRVI